MTKDERIAYYYDLASSPKYLHYDSSFLLKELDLTEEEVEAYRWRKVSERSLKSTAKRDLVVKQVIKPLLKKYGFTTSGIDWHREIDDGYLIIHMQNSQYNHPFLGTEFRFHISASKKEGMRGKLSDQWSYNGFGRDLTQFAFLPYCGMLSPYYAGSMYQIDSNKNYVPSDTPVDELCAQIEEDFGTYILPELSTIHCCDDFSELRAQKLKRYEEKEMRLLRYYYVAQINVSTIAIHNILGDTESAHSVYERLVNMRKELNLTKEDILSHLEWLDICRENSGFTKEDAKALAIQASED